MVSTDGLRVYYLGRYGDSSSPVFVSDNGFLEIYLPESEGYVLYSDKGLMDMDDFVIGEKHVDQWASCCKCGRDSGNFSGMENIGLVHEKIADGVDVSPRSLRMDLHTSLYNEDAAGVSTALLCKECQKDIRTIFETVLEDRNDKITSILI